MFVALQRILRRQWNHNDSASWKATGAAMEAIVLDHDFDSSSQTREHLVRSGLANAAPPIINCGSAAATPRHLSSCFVGESATFMMSTDGTIQAWTDGMRSISGFEEREAVGRHVSMLYAWEDRRRSVPEAELFAATVSGQVSGKGMRLRKNNELFHAEVLISALHDRSGFLCGFVEVMRDLSVRPLNDAPGK